MRLFLFTGEGMKALKSELAQQMLKENNIDELLSMQEKIDDGVEDIFITISGELWKVTVMENI